MQRVLTFLDQFMIQLLNQTTFIFRWHLNPSAWGGRSDKAWKTCFSDLAVHTWKAGSESVVLGWGWRFWFVTSYRVMQVLLIYEAHFEEQKISVPRLHDRPMELESRGLRPGIGNPESSGMILGAAKAETHWPRSWSEVRSLPTAWISASDTQEQINKALSAEAWAASTFWGSFLPRQNHSNCGTL